jgi:hypothetical protein
MYSSIGCRLSNSTCHVCWNSSVVVVAAAAAFVSFNESGSNTKLNHFLSSRHLQFQEILNNAWAFWLSRTLIQKILIACPIIFAVAGITGLEYVPDWFCLEPAMSLRPPFF